ncbi:MAG: 30S ribosomal protein S1 [Acidobacteria bacterium]|nr:30S ribosomal protein S1 [Acidobacteriota bacterium]
MSDLNQPVSPAEAVPSAEDSQTEQTETSFGDILSQFEQEHRAESASSGTETVQGTVVSVNPDNIVIDIGRKSEGVLSLDQYKANGGDPDIKPGDNVTVMVKGTTSEGYYELSVLRVERPKDWTGIQAAFAEKRAVAGRVVESVKGGLRVDIGVRAFMPASRSGAKDVPEMEKLIGEEIQCRITKLDIEKEDVVVDRRVVLEEAAAVARGEAFAQLKEGDVREGNVRSLTEFGAFVDIGGFDGLVHVSDMSWDRGAKPGDVVGVGDRVKVQILKINQQTKKISLGMKQLIPDPWSLAAEKYKPGTRVTGKVARLTDFGAFVELEPGIDGLIHLSEMSWSKKIRKPSEVLKKNEQVEAVVLQVNAADHRIGLGLKQALGDPWDAVEEKYPRGTIVEAPITNLAKFGAFVDLGDGIEGMIHIGDISGEKRLEHPNEVLKSGQTVKAQVLEIDRDRRRLRLGMKQLEPTPADHFIAEHKEGDIVSGRLVEVHASAAKVELGDRVTGMCKFKSQAQKDKEAASANSPKADISSAAALLTAKFKGGGGSSAPAADVPKPGQVRKFRITRIDTVNKRIDLELA